jgi:hypothetical protein
MKVVCEYSPNADKNTCYTVLNEFPAATVTSCPEPETAARKLNPD